MHYDPILCMNMPDKVTAKDASWKAWSLYIDGKAVKQFNSEMPPIKEAREYMKANHPDKVGKLSRNTGSSSGYMVAANDSKTIDQAISVCKKKTKTKDAPKKNWIIIKRMKDPAGQKYPAPYRYIEYEMSNEPGKLRTFKITPENAKEFKDRKDIKWEGADKRDINYWISILKDKENYNRKNEEWEKGSHVYSFPTDRLGDFSIVARNGSRTIYQGKKPIFIGSESDAKRYVKKLLFDLFKKQVEREPDSLKTRRTAQDLMDYYPDMYEYYLKIRKSKGLGEKFRTI